MHKRIRTGAVSVALVAGSFVGAGVVSAQVDDTAPTEQPADETPADEPSADEPAPEENADGERGRRGRRGHHAEWAQATADLLRIDVDELRAARQDGQTLAELAEENGVDPQVVIDARVAAATDEIAAAVEAGRLTEAEAADKLAGLEEKVTTTVNSVGSAGGQGKGGQGKGGKLADDAQVIADLLGIDIEELRAARQDGQTVAEVAEENGVDPQVVIDAKVATSTEKINSAVDEGRLTADEAADKLAEAEERATAAVDQALPERGDHPARGDRRGPGNGRGRGGAPAADAAETDG